MLPIENNSISYPGPPDRHDGSSISPGSFHQSTGSTTRVVTGGASIAFISL